MTTTEIKTYIEHLEAEEKYYASLEFSMLANKIKETINLLNRILKEGIHE